MDQAAAIFRAAQVGQEASAYREHLIEITSSPAFKGSRRSQEFLHHIVEKALNCQFDDLKERALGVELFGRSASYDTGEDAIVRVTASDVRRRLHQYYAEAGPEPELQLDLPSGSYIPEFRHRSAKEAAPLLKTDVVLPPEQNLPEMPTVAPLSQSHLRLLAAFAAGAICVALVFWLLRPTRSAEADAPKLIEPWASMFRPDRQTRIVYCDPDVSRLQGLYNFHISLSDYANHRYVPESLQTGPERQKVIQSMRGVNVASIDAAIALNVSELAMKTSHHVKTHTARSLRLIDFKSEDNFLILGSPRSNPWFALFDEELDFRIEYDTTEKQEVIRNAHPQPGEAERYVPTAQGWDTGHSYAVVAFVPNPGQTGRVLLLAGSNAEATEAAGKLIVNLDLLSKELQRRGIDLHGQPQYFEALLRVSAMAGTSNSFEVIACHKLRH